MAFPPLAEFRRAVHGFPAGLARRRERFVPQPASNARAVRDFGCSSVNRGPGRGPSIAATIHPCLRPFIPWRPASAAALANPVPDPGLLRQCLHTLFLAARRPLAPC
jgi:hypothetical protein